MLPRTRKRSNLPHSESWLRHIYPLLTIRLCFPDGSIRSWSRVLPLTEQQIRRNCPIQKPIQNNGWVTVQLRGCRLRVSAEALGVSLVSCSVQHPQEIRFLLFHLISILCVHREAWEWNPHLTWMIQIFPPYVFNVISSWCVGWWPFHTIGGYAFNVASLLAKMWDAYLLQLEIPYVVRWSALHRAPSSYSTSCHDESVLAPMWCQPHGRIVSPISSQCGTKSAV